MSCQASSRTTSCRHVTPRGNVHRDSLFGRGDARDGARARVWAHARRDAWPARAFRALCGESSAEFAAAGAGCPAVADDVQPPD